MPDPTTPTRPRRTPAGAPSPPELAARVRAARHAAGLTQVQAASRLGISQSSYSDHERATRLPYKVLIGLINTLGYDPAIVCPEISSSCDGEKR